MDVLLIELVLWSGLLALIWGLKEGLGKVEADIERSDALRKQRGSRKPVAETISPNLGRDIIGRYLNHDIYQFIVVHNDRYEFDRVSPPGMKASTVGNELLVTPGLIYRLVSNPSIDEKSL